MLLSALYAPLLASLLLVYESLFVSAAPNEYGPYDLQTYGSAYVSSLYGETVIALTDAQSADQEGLASLLNQYFDSRWRISYKQAITVPSGSAGGEQVVLHVGNSTYNVMIDIDEKDGVVEIWQNSAFVDLDGPSAQVSQSLPFTIDDGNWHQVEVRYDFGAVRVFIDSTHVVTHTLYLSGLPEIGDITFWSRSYGTSPSGHYFKDFTYSCPFPFVSDSNYKCVCPAGFGYDGVTDSCYECIVGYYKQDESLSVCNSCDSVIPYSTTAQSGCVSQDECNVCINNLAYINGICTCAPGLEFQASTTKCVACPNGASKPEYGFESCVVTSDVCPGLYPNSVTMGTSCACGIGYVDHNISGTWPDCRWCEEGMVCDQPGMELDTVMLYDGFWRNSQQSSVVIECPYGPACFTEAGGQVQCIEGHTGPLCAVCEQGYITNGPYAACGVCYENATSAAFFIIMCLIFIIVSIALLYCFRKHIVEISYRIMRVLDHPDVRVQLRIILVYFQILSQFQSVLTVQYPDTYSSFLSLTKFTSVQFSNWFSIPCTTDNFTFYDELLVRTISPITLIAIVSVFWYRARKRAVSEDEKQKAKVDFLRFTFFITFIFFPSASTAVLQTFSCDERFDDGESYLRADYSLTCDPNDPIRKAYLRYAAFMTIVYPIGIPLVYFIVLALNHRAINPTVDMMWSADPRALAEKRQGNVMTLKDHEDAFNSAKSDIKEIEALIQRIAMKDIRLAAIDLHAIATEQLAAYYALLRRRLVAIQFLFRNYRPSVWWFEVVECSRRLMLTGLLVFIYPGTPEQVVVAILICLFYLMFYLWIKPLVLPEHNAMLMAGLWGILLQLYGTMLLLNDQFGGIYDQVGSLMSIIGAVFPFLPLLLKRNRNKVWDLLATSALYLCTPSNARPKARDSTSNSTSGNSNSTSTSGKDAEKGEPSADNDANNGNGDNDGDCRSTSTSAKGIEMIASAATASVVVIDNGDSTSSDRDDTDGNRNNNNDGGNSSSTSNSNGGGPTTATTTTTTAAAAAADTDVVVVDAVLVEEGNQEQCESTNPSDDVDDDDDDDEGETATATSTLEPTISSSATTTATNADAARSDRHMVRASSAVLAAAASIISGNAHHHDSAMG